MLKVVISEPPFQDQPYRPYNHTDIALAHGFAILCSHRDFTLHWSANLEAVCERSEEDFLDCHIIRVPLLEAASDVAV